MSEDEQAVLLRRIDESWHVLQEQLARLQEDEALRQGLVGDWSAKDLMAHIAYWDREAIQRIADTSDGRPIRRYGDLDAVNAEAVNDAAVLPLEAVRRQLRETHVELLRAMHGNPTATSSLIGRMTDDHYRRHAADVSRAIAQAGR